MEAVGKQSYKLKLPAKWHIYFVFHALLLEKNITRRGAVYQKITNQLEFKKREQPKLEIDSIIDNIVFAKEAVNSRPQELYYLIYGKRKTHAKDTWETVKEVFYLQPLLKKY